nr:MAG TPA: hypothetical protein [Caudoviricetes sp.]
METFKILVLVCSSLLGIFLTLAALHESKSIIQGAMSLLLTPITTLCVAAVLYDTPGLWTASAILAALWVIYYITKANKENNA